MPELSKENQEWLDSLIEIQSDSRGMIHADDVRMKLIEMEQEIKSAKLKVLSDIGIELEQEQRINKKSMPFARAIILNKIQDINNGN